VLHGADAFGKSREELPRHGLILYPTRDDKNEPSRQGSVEALIEDIPQLRVCLDRVDWRALYNDKGPAFEDVPAAYELVDQDTDEVLALVRTHQQATELSAIAVDHLGLNNLVIRQLALHTSAALADAITKAEELAAAVENARRQEVQRELLAALSAGSAVSGEIRGDDDVVTVSEQKVTAIDLDDQVVKIGDLSPVPLSSVFLY
jgi:hypothetical protein